jgi:hypothetical protein
MPAGRRGGERIGAVIVAENDFEPRERHVAGKSLSDPARAENANLHRSEANAAALIQSPVTSKCLYREIRVLQFCHVLRI